MAVGILDYEIQRLVEMIPRIKFIVTVILFALHEREKPGNTHDLVPGLGIIPGIT